MSSGFSAGGGGPEFYSASSGGVRPRSSPLIDDPPPLYLRPPQRIFFDNNSSTQIAQHLPSPPPHSLGNFDNSGKGSCETGDCMGKLCCQGSGGVTPATVVEMTLGTATSPLHFYDVSLVDGFNLLVSMKPLGGGVRCGVASCDVDLNICCPSALELRKGGRVVGCKSACLAMQSAKYCCTGSYANLLELNKNS